MSLWEKIVGKRREQAESPQAAASSKPSDLPTPGSKPRASRIYAGCAELMNGSQWETAIGGLAAKHTSLQPVDLEGVERRVLVNPMWGPAWDPDRSSQPDLTLVGQLCDRMIREAFSGGAHKGGWYLDTILLFPTGGACFVIAVWDAPAGDLARKRFPDVTKVPG